MQRYRAEKEYGSMATLTRISMTLGMHGDNHDISVLLTLVQIYGTTYQLHFSPDAVSNGAWWTLVTGFYDPLLGTAVRHLFIVVHFHRYLNDLESVFFHDRQGALMKMIAFFAISSYVYCFVINKTILMGPILRCAIIVVYAHAHKNDFFRNIAGLEINHWRASRLPIVYVGLLAFLDYPHSLGPNSLIPSQVFGLFIGYTYVFITSKLTKSLDPPDFADYRHVETIEFIEPAEFFIYLVLTIIFGRMI